MKKRLIIFILSVGVISILLAMVVIDFFVSKIYTSKEIETNLEAAKAIALNINNRVIDAKDRVEKIAKYPSIYDVIHENSKGYEGKTKEEISKEIDIKDEKWLAASGENDVFVKNYLNNSASQILLLEKDMFSNYFEEIFLTNVYGEMIATTSYLSNLNQAGEYWWEAAYNNGKGQLYIDDRGLDLSSGKFVVGVAAPVYDEGKVVGVLKANLSAETFFLSEIKGFLENYSNTEIYVVRTGGYTIYGSQNGILPQIETGEIALSSEKAYQTFRYKREDGNEYIVSTAIVSSVFEENDIAFGSRVNSNDSMYGIDEGEKWHVIYVTPMDNITYFSSALFSGLFVILLLLLCLGLAFAVMYISKVTNPIIELADAAEIIGHGNLDYKIEVNSKYEIKKLEQTMNQMVENLKITLASRDELENEMKMREKMQKERDEISKHLASQQKMEAIGTLASGVAHEINNPLNGIINYAQIIIDSQHQTDDTKKLAYEIIDESKRVSHIVKNLINFSTHTTGHFSRVDVKELISECLELISTQAMEKQIVIDVDIQEGINSLDCRPQQLKQVIINLITNSIESLNKKYKTDDKNKIVKITVKEIKRDKEPWIQISVIDKGAGIPSKIQEKIFEPFFTTKNRANGIGLGLYVSHSIIHEQGGILTFLSEEGIGSSFIIMLPIINPMKKDILK